MEISKVYEDKNFVVINKPSGVIAHPKDEKDTRYSVIHWFLENYPEAKNIGEDPSRPGIIHRLDLETSGLLILAKTNEAFFYFKNLFKNREIKKYYLALVHGKPKNPKGTINLAMGRIGIKRTTRKINGKLKDQKEAETEYKTIKNFRDFTLLEVAPKTGRTHQIRVHLKSIGNPVAGDSVYGFKKAKEPTGLNRLFLHAYKLEFKTPDGKSLVLETDLPEDLQKIIFELK